MTGLGGPDIKKAAGEAAARLPTSPIWSYESRRRAGGVRSRVRRGTLFAGRWVDGAAETVLVSGAAPRQFLPAWLQTPRR